MELKQLNEILNIVTDFVANGSFKSLNENVKYSNDKDYARLIRLVDYNNKYSELNAIYVTKESYDFLQKSKLFGGEIIISNVGANLGTVFKCPKLKIPMTLGPNSIMIKSKINDDYLFYYFCSEAGQKNILSLVSGSAMPKFNKTDFKKLLVPVPNEDIQHHIVDTIGSIDDLIENYNKINVELYHLLDMVLLKEPSTTACLGDYINLYDNIRKPLSNMQRKGEKIYPYYGATEIIDYVDSYLFDGEYILMAEDGSVINSDETAVVQFITGKSWVGNHAHVIQPKNKLNIYSLYIILKNTNVKTAITGAVQLKINQENLRKLEINIPSNIDTFNQICEKTMRNILNTKQKILELNKLKQSYLNKYFK